MTRLLAIDPGTEMSAYVVYDSEQRRLVDWAKIANLDLLDVIGEASECDTMAIETVQSFGMAVGQEIFTTVWWSGRFYERWIQTSRSNPTRVFRKDVKLHLCGTLRAKDKNIRQALIDRFGPGKERAIGLKATPGPLYGLSSDGWQALGVALTAIEGSQT